MVRQLRRAPMPIKVAAGSLAALVLAAPFLPSGTTQDRDALVPAATGSEHAPQDAVAGRSAVTPEAQAEIDAVVDAGLTQARTLSARSTPAAMVSASVRCADFEGQTYCLHTGWTDQQPEEVVSEISARATQLAARPSVGQTSTGDADLMTTLREQAAMSPTARAEAERAELTEAAAAVAKVWLLRNQIQGVPLPDGFLERHPEITSASQGLGETPTAEAPSAASTPNASPTGTPTPAPGADAVDQSVAARGTASGTATATSSPSPSATPKSFGDYPSSSKIMSKTRTAEQTTTYWCGPTSMQMIGWGWSGIQQSQGYWANKLGTTSGGTAITEMVRVTNQNTGYDNAGRAGTYITLDISDWSYGQWWLLLMRHVHDYRAPLILHPILLKQYYPYLDDDASGHFQVGRGYDKNGSRTNLIGYFEPWNQQRFDPSEPYISRVQWRSAYKSYRANQAHFQHNIGV